MKRRNEMEKADVTKKLLIDAAQDFNKVMGLDPPIKISGRKVTKESLISDLKDAAKELEKDDVIQKNTIEVLIVLGAKLPEALLPKKVSIETKPKAKTTKAKTTKAKTTPAAKIEPAAKDTLPDKTKKYTRAQAFCDSLRGEPKTIEEIAKKAISLYEEKTKKTGTQIKTAIWNVTLSLQPLLILGIVEKADKKYALKKI